MKNKTEVVVVTGASAGVGRATVREFAKRKSYVALIARNKERLAKACEEVETRGGKALAIIADVADPEQIDHALVRIEEHFGPIDIWVNNAMVSVFSPAIEMTAEEFKRVTDVTYLGYVYGTLAALKSMRKRNKGIIIQVGSALAYRAIPLQSAYCAAKHAVQGFTESVRSELIHAKSKVKITMVQLPALNTPQFNWVKSRLERKPQPIPPIYQPEVAARAIVWAADHYRREWYVGITTAIAIIGDKIAPGMGDKYLGHKSYSLQQYNGKADPNAPNNLFESVPGDFGAHGDFDERASSTSSFMWISQHRKSIFFGTCIIILVCVVLGYVL